MFNQYRLLDPQTAVVYARQKLNFFPETAVLKAAEIGDGNLNYVFRVWEVDTGRALIIKQAGPQTRIKPDLGVSPDRIRREAAVLRWYNGLVPGQVPKVYAYDDKIKAIAMEEMTGHEMMRHYCMRFQTCEPFAEQMTDFLSRTLLLTSDLSLDHKQKRTRQAAYSNPELCEITEELVFTEPYLNHQERNRVTPENLDFVRQEIYEDVALHLAAAKLKARFMNCGQALLHGDLHTGSLFLNADHVFVFDPEFTFYGPMGYDIGNLLANLIFSWSYARAQQKRSDLRIIRFKRWILQTIQAILDLFQLKFGATCKTMPLDPMAKTPGFKSQYLRAILLDTAGYTGTELIRRIVGLAKVAELTGISDRQVLVQTERRLIRLAKSLMLQPHRYLSGFDYVDAMQSIVADGKMIGESQQIRKATRGE